MGCVFVGCVMGCAWVLWDVLWHVFVTKSNSSNIESSMSCTAGILAHTPQPSRTPWWPLRCRLDTTCTRQTRAAVTRSCRPHTRERVQYNVEIMRYKRMRIIHSARTTWLRTHECKIGTASRGCANAGGATRVVLDPAAAYYEPNVVFQVDRNSTE